MYHEHFGFQSPPFEDRLAQDGEVFVGTKQRTALANLKIALGTRDAAVVLTGSAGVGKTTLGAHSLRTTTTRLALAWIGLAPLTGHELLEHLLTEFGFNPYKCSRVERLQMWHQFLNEMSLTETRVAILIEKADSLGRDVLQTLASLTSATPNGCPGANIILTGDPALRNVLGAPGLENLRQRTRLSQTLDALDFEELGAFLDYKLGAAAASTQAVFAPGAVAMLHRFSEGRIRVVKNLCETALTVAAARKERQLTPQVIAQVAVGLFGLEPPRSAATEQTAPQKLAASPRDTARAPDTAQAPKPTAVQETAPLPETESAKDRPAGQDTFREQFDGPDDDVDVPTLTDSVEIVAEDPLLEDVAASERASAETASPAPTHDLDSDNGNGNAMQADTPAPNTGLDDDEQPLDPQQDALQAFANAQALEDISNSMAETLFGDAELAQLGATLAVADSGGTSSADTRAEREPAPTQPQDGDAHRAVPAVGGPASRFA